MGGWVICSFLNRLIKHNINSSLHILFLCGRVANYSPLTESGIREQYSKSKVGKFLEKAVDEYQFVPVNSSQWVTFPLANSNFATLHPLDQKWSSVLMIGHFAPVNESKATEAPRYSLM